MENMRNTADADADIAIGDRAANRSGCRTVLATSTLASGFGVAYYP